MSKAHDQDTLGFYASEADAYASRGVKASPRLDGFLKHLKPGALILELGCGAGQDSEAMLAQGFDVHPTDGTAEITAAAGKRLGVPVRILLFEDIDAVDTYHGVWANACLLHVPRAGLPDIIARIHRALKPHGVFYASFKAGDAEGHDRFGRFYNYPSEDWLSQLYATRPWGSVTIEAATGGGYDGEPTDWLHVTAVKD